MVGYHGPVPNQRKDHDMTGPHIPRGMEHRDWSGYDPDWTSLQRDRENNPTPPPVVADANLPFASVADQVRDMLHTCIDDLRVYARMMIKTPSDPTVAEDIRVWGHRLIQSAERLDNEAGRKPVPDTQPRWILLTPDEVETMAALKNGTATVQVVSRSQRRQGPSTIIREEGGKTTDQLQRGDAVLWQGQVYTVLDVVLEAKSMHDPNNNLHTITWDEHPEGTSDTHTARAGVVWWMATPECTCHHEPTETTHELCCGHDGGRNPDCSLHGDGLKG